jgi:hypothetical protein
MNVEIHPRGCTKMPIDLRTQKALSVKELARLVPTAKEGHPTDEGRIVRFIERGVRDRRGNVHKLAALRIGSQWVSTVEALQEFGEALAAASLLSGPARLTTSQARKAIERADRDIECPGR